MHRNIDQYNSVKEALTLKAIKIKAILSVLGYICLVTCLQCSAENEKKPGTRSRLVYKTLDIAHLNDRIFKKLLEDPPRGKEALSKKKIHRSLQVEERTVDGSRLLTIAASADARKHIFFLHGGAYIARANAGHRKLIELLARNYDYRVTIIDYPLAPEHDIRTGLAVLEQAYMIIVTEYPDDVFYLMGDSAGGGLALSLLQCMRDNRVERRPEKTVLFSPWLDVSMSNPGIDTLIEKDVLLHREGLIACGKCYSGSLDLQDPLLSPVFGDISDLSRIKVFVSTHELFYPDCLLLSEKAGAAANTCVDLSVKKMMIHDWVILPLKERAEALEEVDSFLKESF